MNTMSLHDAVRADMRSRLALIRSLYEIDDSLKIVGQMVDIIRDETSEQQEEAPTDQNNTNLAADLVTLDTAIQDLADRVLAHRRAIATVLFGHDQ